MNFNTYLFNFSKNFTEELINIIPTSGLNTSNLKKAIVYTIKVGVKVETATGNGDFKNIRC